MSEAHADTQPGHQIERLVFFSDAVFAIAITLLVIEIHPPHLNGSPDAGVAFRALLALLPEMFGFAVSFFVIGAFWAGHHRAFALAGHWDDRLVSRNLFLLLSIVAMPFFTAFMSANANARLPTMLYSGWLLLAALFNIGLQRRVTSPPVIADGVRPMRIAAIRRRGLAVALGAASAFVATAIAPWPGLGMMALVSIPLWRRLLDRRA